MRYTHRHRCVNCKTYLSHHVVMYSHGRCPACGYKGPNACTIVDTIEEVGFWKGWWPFREWVAKSD